MDCIDLIQSLEKQPQPPPQGALPAPPHHHHPGREVFPVSSGDFLLLHPSTASLLFTLHLSNKAHPAMFFAPLLFVSLMSLAGVCSGGSDAPRGVAVGFVFDLKAKCEPPCEHAGVCIRNNTCFCSRGYEGETCQYGDVTNLLSARNFKFWWWHREDLVPSSAMNKWFNVPLYLLTQFMTNLFCCKLI